MRAVVAALQAPHRDGALGQVDIVPMQIAGFADPQAMPEDPEAD